MTTISTNGSVATLVNVFTVDPARQRELVTLLVAATEEVMCHLPGFVSANIHASTDGTRVVNYAQWRTAEDFQAMLSDPEAGTHMRQAAQLAEYDPHLYDVVSIHTADPAA